MKPQRIGASPALVGGLVTALATASVLGACSTSGANTTNDTVVVWDYYGASSPLKPALEAFKKSHPEISIDYQEYDYDTFQDKLAVAASSGGAPDLATIDMVWVPVYASQGVLSDLGEISGGRLNGKPIEEEYSEGAKRAMTYEGKTVVMPYDFDVYALYYRDDILQAKGLSVPKTHDELLAVAKAMAEDRDGDGTVDKYGMMVRPDTFEYSQFLFQEGGALVDKSGKKAAFASDEGIKALEYMRKLMENGGIFWSPAEGDSGGIAGISDERIGMFLNGPYMMGTLKEAVPDQAGKWAVAEAPWSVTPGSYLGGTGLVVPQGAANPTGAWTLAQFLLEPQQQELVWTSAGAAPATLGSLEMPALSQPDPYFGGQEPFAVFGKALETATPFPYVAGWNEIDRAVTDAVMAALIGESPSKDALEKAAQTANEALEK